MTTQTMTTQALMTKAMTRLGSDAGAGSLRRRFSLGAGGLAVMLLAATPALGAATEISPLAAPAASAATTLAMNGAAPGALATVMPTAGKCPEAAAQPLPPVAPPSATAEPGARKSPCLGALTGKLLGLAARKAGEFLSVPVLVF